MPRVGPERWPIVSPYLDRALDFADVGERSAWLASLRDRDPELATDVEALLQQHQASRDERFLERPIVAGPMIELGAGAPLGAYTLVAPIGGGGMGTVWLAERSDGRFERRVAIKLLNRLMVGDQERFRREGRILARLAHRHIAQLLDAGISSAGQPYLVLEYVDGDPIDRYCDDRRLDVHARLRLFLEVCEALAHAHASLIVHRDLKPSNVLVTRDGHVKLLDFGIAKLLESDSDTATSLTVDGAAAMTPAYAAPEQITGQPISTATDVYALGVLMYELLTGRHPVGSRSQSPADLVNAIVHAEPARPSEVVSSARLRRALRGDLDTIVGVALKKAPAERFASVMTLADDVRRHLRHEPIHATTDSIAYRGRKFLRRNRLAVAAICAVVASLSVGLYVANRQRGVAERRFALVRGLANTLFDIDAAVRPLPGNVAARQLIVDTSLDYLRQLANDAQTDPDLALDVGTAYLRVARVQGVPISQNLGQLEQAEQTLRAAEPLMDFVVTARPGDRIPLLRQAQIAHDRMILAGLRRPDDEALPLARESATWLEKYLGTGDIAAGEERQVLLTLNNVGNRFRIEGEFDEALRLTRRGLDLAASMPDLQSQLGGLWIGMTRIHRDRGSLDDALQASTNALTTLEPVAKLTGYSRQFALALVDHGMLLGNTRGVSLHRRDEAIVHMRRAFDMVDGRVHQDLRDAETRGLVSTAGRALADLLRDGDAGQALDVYEHVLRHLGEIANNSRFRRDEVRALAGSAYALQRLGRTVEARQRLDAAFERLDELKLYPADRIDLDSEAGDALMALADFRMSTGDARGALESSDRLLQAISHAEAAAGSRLDDAAELSQIWASVAAIQRRSGRTDGADALDARRLRLWQHWNSKLPANPFVVGQLAEARVYTPG